MHTPVRTVHKHDLARAVADKVGQPISHVEAALDAFLEQMAREVAAGRKVTMSGYFTVGTVVRKPRRVRAPGSDTVTEVPARIKVVFRAGSELKRWTEARLPGSHFFGTPEKAGAGEAEGEHVRLDPDAIRDALGRLGGDPKPKK